MHDVLHVPNLACNLFSTRVAVKGAGWIRGPKGALDGMDFLGEKLYRLKCELVTGNENALMMELSDIDLWYQRLGHLNRQQLNTLVNQSLASGIKLSTTSKLSFCEGCVEGKIQHKPFKPVIRPQSMCADPFESNRSMEVDISSRLLVTIPNVCLFFYQAQSKSV